ncbi:MAG: DUF3473 domain-containing protein [Planctomycetota bacterium]|nr:MAG: DUF3473 domain-containing protein [Planctomycetota bacterium]
MSIALGVAPIAANKPATVATAPQSLNCLSVDVEEYFHAEAFARKVLPIDWPRWECRAAPRLERIAELLEQHRSRATFFVLGWTIRYLAPILRDLIAAGHEIASHGDEHGHIARMTPQQLREDLRRSRERIEDVLGVRPRGYRAPTFSVTRATAWALDEIIDAGFQYDASIFPIRHDRYGVPDAPCEPFVAVAPSGRCIPEFPPLTLDCGFARMPVGGGGYLRLLPGWILRACIAGRQRISAPTMVYLHPWELDPDQPAIAIGPVAQWRHRVNLATTEAKLVRLLRAFRFETAHRILTHVSHSRNLPVFHLNPMTDRSADSFQP